jgi:hypothetical protein
VTGRRQPPGSHFRLAGRLHVGLVGESRPAHRPLAGALGREVDKLEIRRALLLGARFRKAADWFDRALERNPQLRPARASAPTIRSHGITLPPCTRCAATPTRR